MTQKEVSYNRNVNLSTVEEIVETFLHKVKFAVYEGSEVNLANFGKFKSKKLLMKNARNPRTGEKVAPREVRRIKFSPSKSFKESLN